MNIVSPVSQEVALPSVFSARFLSANDCPVFSDNIMASRYIRDMAIKDLGGTPITSPSVEGDKLLSSMLVSEVEHAVGRSGMRANSSDWYTKSIQRMISVISLLHPEIQDDAAAANHPSTAFRNAKEAQIVLFSAMAITSQNINVRENMRYALEQYRLFCENGRFSPRGYGAKGAAVESNLARFNFILDRAKGDLTRVRRLLMMKIKMNELQKIAEKNGIVIGAKELANETVHGSMIFGPKVGNGFLQNLLGNHSPVTIDLWFMRLWGRYTGTLIRDEVNEDALYRLKRGVRRSLKSERMTELMRKNNVLKTPDDISDMQPAELLQYVRDMKNFWERLRKKFVEGTLSASYTERQSGVGKKLTNSEISDFKKKLMWPGASEAMMKSLGAPIDAPKNASTRKWIRDVVSLAVDQLKNKGYEMTAADLQATLWYPEKEIYARLTGRSADIFNTSYDEAIIEIALAEGVQKREIQEILECGGAADNMETSVLLKSSAL